MMSTEKVDENRLLKRHFVEQCGDHVERGTSESAQKKHTHTHTIIEKY